MKTIRSPRNGSANSLQQDLFAPVKLTSEASKTCDPATLPDTRNVTSSPASASGASRSGKPDGPTTGPYGLEAVRANLSARQAKQAGLLTSGTFGPRSTILSESADLQSSLANRLRAKTASLGSTLYRLTWKARVTPSGRSIPALRASALRTSGSGSTSERKGWVSPTAQDGSRGDKEARPHDTGVPLSQEAILCGWPTPDAACFNINSTWEVTQARRDRLKAKHGNSNGAGLVIATASLLAGWPTPAARDFKSNEATEDYHKDRWAHSRGKALNEVVHQLAKGPARLTAAGEMLTGCSAGMASGGQLSPRHSLWLMLGPFATAWLNCAERVTRSTSRKQQHSSSQQEKR